MEFPVLPPEVNSARMHAGAGAAPMLTAAAAWDGLAAELCSAAGSFGSVKSRVAGKSWQGPSSLAMIAAAAPYVEWRGPAAELVRRLPSRAAPSTPAVPASPGTSSAPTTSVKPSAAATPASYRSVFDHWLYDELNGASNAFHNAAQLGPAAVDDAKALLTFPSDLLGWQSYVNTAQSLVENAGGYLENVAVGTVDLVALPATLLLVPVTSLADSVSTAFGLPVPDSAG